MPVSVISPVLNERDNVAPLIESLMSQTVVPDEIVVADGGSTDGTREALAALAVRYPIVRVVDGPGGISENRNAAIAASAHELVACIDTGCIAEPDWLENLIAPFSHGEDWVAGFYRPHGPTLQSTCAGLALMSVLEEVDPAHFIPAGNSQAFRKKMWEQIGGFPEGMVAAEDTLFGERAIAAGYRAYFDGTAVVRWRPPDTLLDMTRKAFRWGRADGEAGLRRDVYRRVVKTYWGSAVATAAAATVDVRLVPIALAPLGAVVAKRTRYKYRWAHGPAKYLLIPAAHTLQLLAQSLGWAVGSRTARP